MVLDLASAHLAGATAEAYGNKWRQFEVFCSERGLTALPATPQTVALYVASLSTRGSIAPGSVQQYLSAINAVHRDLQMPDPSPALGPVIDAVRAGWAHSYSARPNAMPSQRIALPAAVAYEALQLAASPSAATIELPVLRALVYTAFGFQLMARAGTDISLESQHVILDGTSITVRLEHEKGKHHWNAKRILVLPASAVPLLYAALTNWAAARARAWTARAAPASFWRLPSDIGGWKGASSVCSGWLREACDHLGRSPPPGHSWTSHSLRKGAASACSALGVTLDKIRFYGGWAHKSSAVNDYVDPTVEGDNAAQIFFGWLVPSLLRPTTASAPPTSIHLPARLSTSAAVLT